VSAGEGLKFGPSAKPRPIACSDVLGVAHAEFIGVDHAPGGAKPFAVNAE
jgi:hypothetical protein